MERGGSRKSNLRLRPVALGLILVASLFLLTTVVLLQRGGREIEGVKASASKEGNEPDPDTPPKVPPIAAQPEQAALVAEDGEGIVGMKKPQPPQNQNHDTNRRANEGLDDREFGLYPDPEDGSCSGEINIITQAPHPNHQHTVLPELGEGVKDVSSIEKDRNYATEKGPLHRLRRQEEYFDTLRKNLRNPHVKRIHLLLEKEGDMELILAQGMPDACGKLHPVGLGKWMHYRDAFEYANGQLDGELCMIMNADIYLAKGFHAVTKDLFESKGKPHAYVLARWEGPSVYCVDKKAASCTTRAKVGSYDAFLFLSPLPLDEEDLKSLDFQQNIWGAENTVLSVLTKNGVSASNPCEILQVGHNHCDTYFRPQQGLHDGKYRVQGGGGGSTARFVREL